VLHFTLKHPGATALHLGYVPTFLSEDDPRPAAVQINEHYAHGGGWSPMRRGAFAALADDPPLALIAEARLRDETLRFYEGSWLSITQPDGSFEVSRLD
jgi:hypothetical protein